MKSSHYNDVSFSNLKPSTREFLVGFFLFVVVPFSEIEEGHRSLLLLQQRFSAGAGALNCWSEVGRYRLIYSFGVVA
jgi:hypothetical protein